MHAAVLVAAAMANVWSSNPAANPAPASPAVTATPAPLPITPAPLEPEEQAMVGYWSVDVAATWSGVAAWRQAHPGAAADRTARPDARAEFEAMAAGKAFELRPDRRWLPLSARGESTTWQFGRGTMSAACFDAPSSYRPCALVGSNLVEYDRDNQSFPVVYSRAELGPAVVASEVVGEWAVDEAASSAIAQRVDASAAARPARISLFADGRGGLASASGGPAQSYQWRADGDLIFFTPSQDASGHGLVLRRTSKGFVSVSGSASGAAQLAWTRASASPSVANVPSAAKGD